MTGMAWRSRITGYPPLPGPRYELADIDMMQAVSGADIVPADPSICFSYLRHCPAEATVYGLPAVYQYTQMMVAIARHSLS